MSRSLPTSKVLTTTSTALLASLLFVGCGSNGESSDANATASSSSTSASSSPSSSQNSSAQPDQSATASSSEKSTTDATNGKYKPADEHGPAQNVPKPVKPEGMDVETPEAMEKFIYYWNDLRNYAVQTGDTTEIRKYVALDDTTEIDNYDSWSEIYARNGWIIGGTREAKTDLALAQSLGDGKYIATLNYDYVDAVVTLDGKFTGHKLTEYNGRGYALRIQLADDGQWYVLGEEEVN
ncbi:DUF6318 family protein [Rothia amarae]|uniref:DUF6318 family protein n=1 Tax=Rothia amarae TaxID=169480 RepID=UPI0012475522